MTFNQRRSNFKDMLWWNTSKIIALVICIIQVSAEQQMICEKLLVLKHKNKSNVCWIRWWMIGVGNWFHIASFCVLFGKTHGSVSANRSVPWVRRGGAHTLVLVRNVLSFFLQQFIDRLLDDGHASQVRRHQSTIILHSIFIKFQCVPFIQSSRKSAPMHTVQYCTVPVVIVNFWGRSWIIIVSHMGAVSKSKCTSMTRVQNPLKILDNNHGTLWCVVWCWNVKTRVMCDIIYGRSFWSRGDNRDCRWEVARIRDAWLIVPKIINAVLSDFLEFYHFIIILLIPAQSDASAM